MYNNKNFGFGINIMATTRCNMNCRYCKQRKDSIDISEENLRIALIEAIQNRKTFPQFVTLSGGEVTILGKEKIINLFKVVEEESFLSMRVLNTNGSADLDLYLDLKKADVGCIFFSLDDINNLEKIKKIRIVKESGYYRVKLNHVYKDYESTKKLINIAKDLDVFCQIMTNVHSETNLEDFEKNKKTVLDILGKDSEIRSENEDHCSICSSSGQRVIVKNGVFKNNVMLFVLPNGKLTTDFNKILTGEF